MKHKKTKTKKKKGFTIIEILIAISILVILAAIIYGSLQSYRNRGKDTRVRQTLSDIQVKLEDQEVAPGADNYQAAFANVDVQKAISTLATQLGVPAGSYDLNASATEYAVVFPLSTGLYYCIDATRSAKEVTGLLNTSGPINCDNATRNPSGTGLGGAGGVASNPATRTLTAKDPLAVPQMGPYAKYAYYESLPRGYYDDPARKWPLLIFMHGQGEEYPPLTNVLRYGVPKEINNGAQLEYSVGGKTDSFVVIAPQSDWWHPYVVDAFIEYAKQNYNIDPTRIYLSGLSVGQAAAIYYAAYSDTYANKIAGIATSDGVYGGIPTQLYNPGGTYTALDYCRINRSNLPVWMFYANGHAPDWTTGVANLINNCTPPVNPPLKVTYCTNTTCTTNKRAWDQAFLTDHSYQNPNIYEWLLAQHR